MCHLGKTIHYHKIGIRTLDVLGNPKMKSIEISTQGIEGIGRGVYKPWGCTLDLAL